MNTNRLFDVAAAVPAAILNSSQATRLPLQFRGAHPARVLIAAPRRNSVFRKNY